MRLLLGLLASSSRHVPRHQQAKLFGDSYPQLATEEFQALAGVWRADLQLNDEDVTISLHLADPKHETEFPPGGDVFPIEDSLPFSVRQHELNWRSARWSVSRYVYAGQQGDDILGLSVQLGNLALEGRGQRAGLRCRAFVGKVYETSDVPKVIGRFSLQLALPIKADTLALEKQYQQRISARSAPPRDADGDERCDVLSNLLRACAVAAEEAQLMEDCESGDDLACETLSREEEAKRAWLAKLDADAPSWVQHAAAGAASTAEEEGTSYLAEACDDGDDLACAVLSREEEAKRAWLARLDPPGSWGPQHGHGPQ